MTVWLSTCVVASASLATSCQATLIVATQIEKNMTTVILYCYTTTSKSVPAYLQ